MLWILLSLLGAVTNASYFIIIKRYITTLDPKVLTGIGFAFGGLLLLAFSAIRGFPVIGQDFYSAVAITAILNIISLTLIFKALSSTDLSLSIPMLSFTPVILIGTSYLLLNEVPSIPGVAGICIIVIGSYVLNISSADEHLLDPVKSMLRNRGSWYMLIVAFLFAVSINFDKIAMLNSDPFFGMALTVLAIGDGIYSYCCLFPHSCRTLSSQKTGEKESGAPGSDSLHSRRENISLLQSLLAYSSP